MNIIALDLGTKTGWAANVDGYFSYGLFVPCSEAELKVARKVRLDRRLDPRIPRLFDFLDELSLRHRPQLLVFEDVLFASTRMQAHLWASFRTVVWMQGYLKHLPVDCLNTSGLKRFATGEPSAGKEKMISALRRAEPKLDFGRIDDNVADAIWLWKWAQKTFKV